MAPRISTQFTMAAIRSLGRRFLLWCAHEHNDFRIPEITSLAKLFQIEIDWIEKNDKKPFILVDVKSEDEIRKLMSRTMLIGSAYELWGRAKTHEELHCQLKVLPKEFLNRYSDENTSFRIRIETFCKHLSAKQKLEKIETLDYLPMKGQVKLADPNVSLAMLEFYGLDPNCIPELPYDLFFGRWICDGQRHKICKLHLKERKFIGNTSMDAQLSLIMANQALATENALIYDPFVGTGSLLVAAAYFGAYVFGADIDYMMLHGKAKPTRVKQKQREVDECVAANLSQYGLSSSYLDVVVADSSLPIWRRNFTVDAIIADPPYGIREATERIGTTKSYTIKEEHVKTHIPSKVMYNLQEMYHDLLNFAATNLKMGGRLVYWLPVFLETYTEESVPKHPCLDLLSNSEQPLAKHASRRLITMTKVKEPEENETQTANVPSHTSLFPKQFLHGFLEEPIKPSRAEKRADKRQNKLEQS